MMTEFDFLRQNEKKTLVRKKIFGLFLLIRFRKTIFFSFTQIRRHVLRHLCSAASDLGLHYLPMSNKGRLGLNGLKL